MTVRQEKHLDELLKAAGYELVAESEVYSEYWYLIYEAMQDKEQETLH